MSLAALRLLARLVLCVCSFAALNRARAVEADWEIAPDPPAAPIALEFTDDFRIEFPTARFSHGHRAFFSAGGRFVLLAQNDTNKMAPRSVWDLQERREIASIQGGPTGTPNGILSPDGRWFASKELRSVEVWALDGSARVKSIAAGRNNLDGFEFLPGDRLLTISSDRNAPSLVVWDLNTADSVLKQKEEIDLDPKSICVSPGRSWLAALRKHKNDLLLIDLRALKVRETISLGKPNRTFWHSCDGMAFSPDGKELAGVFYGFGDYSIRVWNMTTGEEVLQIPIQGSIAKKFRNSSSGELHWLPGGRGWLACGETLVDRKTRRTIATITTSQPSHSAMPPRPVDASHLAMVTGEQNPRVLRLLTIPYDTIDAALKDADSDKPATLRQGQKIGLRIEVAGVRFAERDKVEAELRKAFTAELASCRLTVADDAPATLSVRYDEVAGKPLSFRPPTSPVVPLPQPGNGGAKVTSTGTGFVLTANGYLVTCAHVVGNAKTVKVKLGEADREAKVVGKDSESDLALLKIEAQDLETLPLADSDKVELGEELRVFGHPLSDELGDSVKATRGSLAGIVKRNNRKLLQIDASVNPGNSGGPVVDEKGNVVGVTTQKLVGAAIDNIGLAVPSNALRKLLEENKVKPDAPPAEVKLDGPALFKRVSKAIALITSDSSGGDGTIPEGTITSTQIKADLVLTAAGAPEAIWKRSLTTDPSAVAIVGKATEETLREAVFRTFQAQVGSISLPYYISAADPQIRLPFVLDVPK